MIAVFKRDFRSLFTNVVGWLFIGINLAVYGLYFFAYNLNSGAPSISNTIYGITFLLMITVPILTMRSLSEERRNHTDQLLLTSPLSIGKMVLGKFLALGAVFTIVCLVIGISPLFLRIFGTVAMKESYTTLLGYWLYGLACIAIGIFISSFTESQMIAAIVTVIVLFIGYMMSAITSLISNPKFLTTILNCYDLNTPFDNFRSGILEISSVVYYISIMVLCLFLAVQVIQKRRWTVSVKRLTTGAFSIGSIVVLLAVLVAGNIGITKLPSRYTSIDMTKQKYYSLTSTTKKYLSSLKQDITIYVMNTKSAENKMTTLTASGSSASTSIPYSGETVNKTLNVYDGNSHIKVKYIDPDENPTFSSTYSDENLNTGSLIVVNDKTNKAKTIDASSLFKYSADYSSYSYRMTGYDAEGQITSAIQAVTSDSNDKVYLVRGHSESELGSSFTEYITKKNMTTDSLNLRTDDIPSDCSILIMNGPVTDLSSDEVTKLETYLNNGGKAIFTISLDAMVSGDSTPNYLKLLSDYGITATYGLVEDSDSNHTAPNYSWLLYPNVASSDLTKGISASPSVLVPQAAGMKTGGNSNMTYTDFLTTSASASLVNPSTGAEISTGSNTPSDQSYVLGTEVATDGTTNNLIVLASPFMLVDDVESLAPGQNTKLFSNMLNAFGSDSSKNAVTIASKSYQYSTLQFSQKAVILYGVLWGLVLPVVLIIVGIVIWAVRRRR